MDAKMTTGRQQVDGFTRGQTGHRQKIKRTTGRHKEDKDKVWRLAGRRSQAAHHKDKRTTPGHSVHRRGQRQLVILRGPQK